MTPTPEALSPASGTDNGFAAAAGHVELLGHESLVHANLAPATSGKEAPHVTARIPGTHRLDPGESVALRPDPQRLYFFNDHGVRL